VAAAALTILPELLRQFNDYRMLAYAVILILVMLATNNKTVRSFIVNTIGGVLRRLLDLRRPRVGGGGGNG
jgi:hypothetical protein